MQRSAYSYIRFSSADQAKGQSLRRQLEASQRYADQHGLVLDTSLRDLGKSAYKGDHLKGSLGAFRDAVQSGRVPKGSVLIVESLDRLSRAKVPAALSQFISLIEAGVEIVTLTDGRSYSAEALNQDWTSLVVSLAIMSRAHEESVTKSNRIGDVWERRRKLAADKPMTSRRPAWLDFRGGKFSVNEAKAAIVRRLFSEVAEHGYGLMTMARRLNEEGVPTLTAKRDNPGWQHWQVDFVLKSRSAFGELQPMTKLGGKQQPACDPIPNYYPAVISRELFDRVQQVQILNRKTGGPRRSCVPNLLQGRMFCAECGGKLRVRTHSKGRVSYVCDTAFRGLPGCDNRRFVVARPLERGIMDGVALLGLRAPPEAESPVAVLLRERIGEIAGRVDAAKARMARLIAVLEDAPDDPIADVVARVRTLGREIEALEAAKAEAERELQGVASPTTIGDIIDAVEELRAEAYSLDFTVREEARTRLSLSLRSVVDEVRINSSHTARVVCRGGLVTFSVTAGKLHDVVFAVRDQRWRLLPDGDMERIAA